ncbi:hypothetical protein CPB86DRAFT_774712 [Serendipita vermifera]|nr:hypothetical protein CPB86DRAFT_774712 [Serendipita vermifera]
MARTAHQFDDKKANLKVLIAAIGAKEVDCRVRLTIHTVTNLPVLNGAFRVRWKFRDTDSKAAVKFKDQQLAVGLGFGGIGNNSNHHNNVNGTNKNAHAPSHSILAALGEASSLMVDNFPTKTAGASSASSSSATPSQTTTDVSTDEKGSTPYRNLRARDHTVTFEHVVEVVAHMRIIKGELIGEPLKLVVERHADDSELIGTVKKSETRIGHKYIDLAEFVNEGKIRRKFLLERSKTNAMVTVSLDIATLKTGIDFRKPDLKQDHLLIGRKETPLATPRREKPLVNTTDSSRPSLSRSSSTTSSAPSSARAGSFSHHLSRGLPPPRDQTEAVIEALFNPTIFSAPLVSTPSSIAPGSRTPKVDEPFTPRPRDAPKKESKGPRLSSVVDEQKRDLSSDSEDEQLPGGDGPRSRPRTKASTGTRHSDSPESKRHTSGNKTALDIALDMNYRMDRDKTIRPKLPSGSGHSQQTSWEMVDYPDGSKGIKRRGPPHRSTTVDSTTSTRTDFSTTSSRGPPTRSSSDGRSTLLNTSPTSSGAVSRDPSGISAVASGVLAMPTISIIAETPTTATQDQSRWYKPFRKGTGQTTSSKNSRSSSRSRDTSLDLGHNHPGQVTPTPPKAELATGA